jgi:hypothetical protein
MKSLTFAPSPSNEVDTPNLHTSVSNGSGNKLKNYLQASKGMDKEIIEEDAGIRVAASTKHSRGPK